MLFWEAWLPWIKASGSYITFNYLEWFSKENPFWTVIYQGLKNWRVLPHKLPSSPQFIINPYQNWNFTKSADIYSVAIILARTSSPPQIQTAIRVPHCQNVVFWVMTHSYNLEVDRKWSYYLFVVENIDHLPFGNIQKFMPRWWCTKLRLSLV